ncbi:hypothetical protein CT0861_01445 [Colletotrichum tofieldiae]|uniref:Uncharacterized protein n=1 Tax=Colletotrichum tofieldiae TaxID=708197 RepID=A0A166TSU7_9PEZI|nr:hypothetical protein CT0861_01445 [Colletotrichum tofieldiae]
MRVATPQTALLTSDHIAIEREASQETQSFSVPWLRSQSAVLASVTMIHLSISATKPPTVYSRTEGISIAKPQWLGLRLDLFDMPQTPFLLWATDEAQSTTLESPQRPNPPEKTLPCHVVTSDFDEKASGGAKFIVSASSFVPRSTQTRGASSSQSRCMLADEPRAVRSPSGLLCRCSLSPSHTG